MTPSSGCEKNCANMFVLKILLTKSFQISSSFHECVSLSERLTKVFPFFSFFLRPEMHWKKSPQKVLIGFFSVASKLTGVFQDDLAITSLLHDYGALAIWDYTTAAPYATIDMNPYVRCNLSLSKLIFIRTSFFVSVSI